MPFVRKFNAERPHEALDVKCPAEVYDLGSRLLRPGAEDLATPRQPVRHAVVTHVLRTWCYLCVRAGHRWNWRARRDSNSRTNILVYLKLLSKFWTEGQVEGQDGARLEVAWSVKI
jgi:hypothetical protein